MFAKSLNSKGAGLVEYGILVGLIATTSVVAVLSLGGEIESVFSSTDASLAAAIETVQDGDVPSSGAPAVPATTHVQEVAINGISSFPTSPDPASTFFGPLTATSDPATVCTLIGYPGATDPQIISGRNLTAVSHALTTVYSLQSGFNFVSEGTLTNNSTVAANDPDFITSAIIIESIDCS